MGPCGTQGAELCATESSEAQVWEALCPEGPPEGAGSAAQGTTIPNPPGSTIGVQCHPGLSFFSFLFSFFFFFNTFLA